MRTTREHKGHAITLDNGQYSSRHPKPVEHLLWDGENGQTLEVVPPLQLAQADLGKLAAMAASRGITILGHREVEPVEGEHLGATLLKVDIDRNMTNPVPVFLALGREAIDEFGQDH